MVKIKKFIITCLKKFNAKNINNAMDTFNRCTDTFNKTVHDFGDSMDMMTKEMSSDIEKSNKESVARERKNKENLDKIWGRRN